MTSKPRPRPRNSRNCAWMKVRAATSRPRVGWAATSTSGSKASARASRAFCRLPPDSVPVRVSGPGARMSKRRICSSTQRRIAAVFNQPRRLKGASPTWGSSKLSESGAALSKPSLMRSSGTEQTPSFCMIRGVARSTATLSTAMCPWLGGAKPAISSASARWPLPDTPATPTISPPCSVRLTSDKRAGRPRSPATPMLESCSSTRSTVARGLVGGSSSWPHMSSASWRSFREPSLSRVATIRPRRMIASRWVMVSTSRSLWLMNIMPTPSATRARSASKSRSLCCGVSTEVGSSRIRMRAPRTNALTISTRCCSPTDRSDTSESLGSSRPYCSPMASMRARTPMWSSRP